MDLTPSKTNLKTLFSAEERVYSVPPYQRDYSWRPENIQQLWNDIIESWKSASDYFMGPFVLNTEDKVSDQFDIVDGQQRLTSFAILFAAIRSLTHHFLDDNSHDVYENWRRNPESANHARAAYETTERRLGWSMSGGKYYLHLNKKDDRFFREKIIKLSTPILDKSDLLYKPATRLIEKAQKCFFTLLHDTFLKDEEGAIKLDAFASHCITRILFLQIVVESSQDAYLLFEGLNHKGLDLSVADLLKNKLLMLCSGESAKQERVIASWDIMVSQIADSRFDLAEYIRTYWSAFRRKPDSPVSTKELYSAIRATIKEANVEAELNEMGKYSEFFGRVTANSFRYPVLRQSDEPSDQCLAEINSLKYSVCYPLLLLCFSKRRSLLVQVAHNVLCYLFRVITICDYSVGRAKKSMSKAMKAIEENKSDDVILACLDDEEVTDKVFFETLVQNSFELPYVARYVLLKIHSYQRGNETSINPDMVDLEHILPVKHDEYWTSFAPGPNTTTDDWICRLGNLTLLAKGNNQSIQNREFSFKIARYRERCGDEDPGSSIPMTYKLCEDYDGAVMTEWTVDSIVKRTGAFAALAPKIWPRPGGPDGTLGT
jgi:uncharacterized protein with ParB-like and HNH nuclease domain